MKGKFQRADDSAATAELDRWEPIIFRRDEIEQEIETLATRAAPADGRRESVFVHPRSTEPGLGLAPGIRVTLCVLEPGERTIPVRHNSNRVDFCIEGAGSCFVDGVQIDFEQYDVWNIPSYRTYWHVNETETRQVRLSYSNAPLLEKLGVHLVEVDPPTDDADRRLASAEQKPSDPSHQSPFGTFQLNDAGAMLMPYETLVDPPAVESNALHWPWREVKRHLDQLDALGSEYAGRRLYLLYNPLTGRTNGTTPSFFATITIRPPGIVDRPHRHISAAINYFFHGTGWSRIAGKRYAWSAGDLMLTAPGWAIHHHASDEGDRVYELTIQDQPLHLAMESLLWQEDLQQPAVLLGSESGFATNRAEIAR